MAEGWKLVDKDATHKELVLGHEEWPFPVPLVKSANGWMFDTAAGKQEVLDRRIGKNELAAIRISQAYVAAQKQYADEGSRWKARWHLCATHREPASQAGRSFLGDEARANRSVHWVRSSLRPPRQGAKWVRTARDRCPSTAITSGCSSSRERPRRAGPSPIVVNGEMSGGFALVAWPSQYGATGIMTFIVGPDGVVREKDLGPRRRLRSRRLRRSIPIKRGAWRTRARSRHTAHGTWRFSPACACLLWVR